MKVCLVIIMTFLVYNEYAFSQTSDSLSLHKTAFTSEYRLNGFLVKKREFKNVLKTKQEAISKYRSGSFQIGSGTLLLGSGIILLASIDSKNPDNPPYWWQWVGGIGGIASGIVLNLTGVRTQLASVKLFNSMELALSTNYQSVFISYNL